MPVLCALIHPTGEVLRTWKRAVLLKSRDTPSPFHPKTPPFSWSPFKVFQVPRAPRQGCEVGRYRDWSSLFHYLEWVRKYIRKKTSNMPEHSGKHGIIQTGTVYPHQYRQVASYDFEWSCSELEAILTMSTPIPMDQSSFERLGQG